MQKISADPKRNRDMEEGKAVDGDVRRLLFVLNFLTNLIRVNV